MTVGGNAAGAVFLLVLGLHVAALIVLLRDSPLSDEKRHLPTLSGMIIAAPLPDVVVIQKVQEPAPSPKQRLMPKPVARRDAPKSSAKHAPKPIVKSPLEKPLKMVSESPSKLPKVVDSGHEKKKTEAPAPASQHSSSLSEVVDKQVPKNVPVPVMPPRSDARHLKNPAPRYPRISQRLQQEGTVILSLLILADGTVDEIGVKASSGYPRLDEAALKAVKQWRYLPATRGGQAIDYRYEQPIDFSLRRK